MCTPVTNKVFSLFILLFLCNDDYATLLQFKNGPLRQGKKGLKSLAGQLS